MIYFLALYGEHIETLEKTARGTRYTSLCTPITPGQWQPWTAVLSFSELISVA